MKTAKKLTLVLLALSMLLCFVACADVEKTGIWESATHRSDKEFGSGAKTVYVTVKAEDQSVVFTTEGNVSDRVLMLAHDPADPTIVGFCAPDFASKIRPQIDGLTVPPIPDETGTYNLTANNNGEEKWLAWKKV